MMVPSSEPEKSIFPGSICELKLLQVDVDSMGVIPVHSSGL